MAGAAHLLLTRKRGLEQRSEAEPGREGRRGGLVSIFVPCYPKVLLGRKLN